MLKGSDRALYRAYAQHFYAAQIEIKLHCDVVGVGKFLCDSYIDIAAAGGYMNSIRYEDLFELLYASGAVGLTLEEYEDFEEPAEESGLQFLEGDTI